MRSLTSLYDPSAKVMSFSRERERDEAYFMIQIKVGQQTLVTTAPSCKFHQHFMSSISNSFLLPNKLQTQTVSTEKLYKTVLYKKVLLKCW